jgi:uncharacterized protein YdcH (DUF465 family)
MDPNDCKILCDAHCAKLQEIEQSLNAMSRMHVGDLKGEAVKLRDSVSEHFRKFKN